MTENPYEYNVCYAKDVDINLTDREINAETIQIAANGLHKKGWEFIGVTLSGQLISRRKK